MAPETNNPYTLRITQVCDYIAQNLDEPLSLEHLSAVAAFSKFHFHRVFQAFTGVTVRHYILLMRLKRASFRLAFEKQKRIIEVAFEAGFEQPEAFARAFRRVFDQSPSEFRSQPRWLDWHKRFQFQIPANGAQNMHVSIVEFQPTKVAKLEHCGPAEKVMETAARFIAWRKETGLSPVKSSKTFGMPYSDPKTTEPEEFRWDICGSIKADVPANDYGVKTDLIPGGRCAMVRHQGSHDTLENTIYYVMREWLPDSGETLRDHPCFFHYHNFVHEVDECDLITDVYVPLKHQSSAS